MLFIILLVLLFIFLGGGLAAGVHGIGLGGLLLIALIVWLIVKASQS